jgi:hypothetical protein
MASPGGQARKGKRQGQEQGDKKKGGGDRFFSALDRDGDGKVSKAEFEEVFSKADKDGDGFIDPKSERPGRPEGKAGKRGKGRSKK